MYNEDNIAERIKARRLAQNLTQTEVAKKADISPKSYIELEKGRSAPRIGTLTDICNVLNCEIDYLLGAQDLPHRADTDICKETGLSAEAVSFLTGSNVNIQDCEISTLRGMHEDPHKEDLPLIGKPPVYTIDFLSYFIPRSDTITTALYDSIFALSPELLRSEYPNYSDIKKIYDYVNSKETDLYNCWGQNSRARMFYKMLFFIFTENTPVDSATGLRGNGILPADLSYEILEKYYNEIEESDFEISQDLLVSNAPADFQLYRNIYEQIEKGEAGYQKQREYVLSELFMSIAREYIKEKNDIYKKQYLNMLNGR